MYATLRRLVRSLAVIVPLFTVPDVKAQELDTLFLRNGQTILCRITEIGLDEIKYMDPRSDLRITMVIDKLEVVRITYANGRREIIRHDGNSVALRPEVLERDQAIKAAPFSPLFGHFTMGYERVIQPFMNLDVAVGVIGVGSVEDFDTYSGILVRGGVKFVSRPDAYARGTRRLHPLHGGYIKPELVFNMYDHDVTTTTTNPMTGLPQSTTVQRQQVTNLAFNIVFGKQRLLGDLFTLDTFIGVGMGIQNVTSDGHPDDSNHSKAGFSHVYLGDQFPMTLTGGLTLGVVF